MTLCPDTRRTVAEGLWPAAQQGQKLLKGAHTERRMSDHDDGWAAEIRDVAEIANRIVFGPGAEDRSYDVRGHAGDQQRVAIRFRAGHLRRGGHAACASTIFNVDLLAQSFRQGLGEDASEGVGRSTGREWHHQLDRTCRPVLRTTKLRPSHHKKEGETSQQDAPHEESPRLMAGGKRTAAVLLAVSSRRSYRDTFVGP